MDTAEILKKVRQIEIKTGRLVSETFAGEYQSVFKGRGMEFSEVREYVPGDDIRDIDWNVTAKFSKPFVKKYSEERELTVMVVCDISGSQFFGSQPKFKNDVSAELAATFAFSALKNGDKTGLLLFTDRTELYIPPRKGKNHILRIIRELIAYKPKSKKTNIAHAIDEVNKLLKRRSIIILISDFLDDDFQKSLKLAKLKHDIIPVVVSDKLEKNIKPINVLAQTENLENESSAFLADFSNPRFLKDYFNLNDERRKKTEKLFSKAGIDFINISTDEEIYKPVMQFFKRREHLRTRM
ncbi:MAG: DUF58 domain-containing protein [Elusimicrobia bacterium]|nr:DUF58 domain-containing protein [Elusimicrobiota bacterium]